MTTRCYATSTAPMKDPALMTFRELVEGLSRLSNRDTRVAQSLIRYWDDKGTFTERQVKLAQKLIAPMYLAQKHLAEVGTDHQWNKVSEEYHYTNTDLRTSTSTATLVCLKCGEKTEKYINNNYAND